MKTNRLLLTGGVIIVGLIGAALLWGSLAGGESVGTTAPETAYKYLEHVTKHEWDKAYVLTTGEFQRVIPLVAFKNELEASGMADTLLNFTSKETKVEGDTAEVEVLGQGINPGDKTPVTGSMHVSLRKENGQWRVDPGVKNFLSMKLELLGPLAVFQHNGVSVSLRSLLLYRETGHQRAHSDVRLDITNDSDHTLRWDLPVPGASGIYLQDLVTGKKYLRLSGQGAKFRIGAAFELTREDPGVLTAAPGTQGTVYIYLELVPETVEEFNMVLSGFSFPDTGESWSVTFSDVPFRFDIAPQD